MTNRDPAARRWQNSSSHHSIEARVPMIRKIAESERSPKVSTHDPIRLDGLVTGRIRVDAEKSHRPLF